MPDDNDSDDKRDHSISDLIRIEELIRAGAEPGAAAEAIGADAAAFAAWSATSEGVARIRRAQATARALAAARLHQTNPRAWLEQQSARPTDEGAALDDQPTANKLPAPRINRYLSRLARDRYEKGLTTRLAKMCPWLQPQDRILLRAFCQLERLALEAHEFIIREGIMPPGADGAPRPHPLLDRIANLRRTQVNIGNQLGLTPRSRLDVRDSNSNPFASAAKRVLALPPEDDETIID